MSADQSGIKDDDQTAQSPFCITLVRYIKMKKHFALYFAIAVTALATVTTGGKCPSPLV